MSDDQISPLCSEIHAYIEAEMISAKRDTDVNRASAAPKCVKQRWYLNQGEVGEPLNARAIITFGFGDLTEHWMKDLVLKACVGPGKTYSEVDFGTVNGTFPVQHREFQNFAQETLEIIVLEGPKVSGHADGWGKRNDTGQWELLEIKSSASYGFDEFVAGETPDYIRQVHALMLSEKAKKLGVKSARFLYMNKNTSHIFDREYKFDPAIAKQVLREFIIAQGKDEPMRPHEAEAETYRSKPTGKYKLPWQCSYCPFTAKCWAGEAALDFKNGRPVWYLKVQKDGTNG